MVADWDTFSDIDDDRVPSDREETYAEARSGIVTNYDLVWYNGICAQNHSFYANHHYRGDCLMIKRFHPGQLEYVRQKKKQPGAPQPPPQ